MGRWHALEKKMPLSLQMLTVMKPNWLNLTDADFYVAKHQFPETQKGWKPIPTKTSSKPLLQIPAWSDVTFQACPEWAVQSFAHGDALFCAEILQVLKANLQHHHTPPPFPP